MGVPETVDDACASDRKRVRGRTATGVRRQIHHPVPPAVPYPAHNFLSTPMICAIKTRRVAVPARLFCIDTLGRGQCSMLQSKARKRDKSTAFDKFFSHRLLRPALTGLEAPATCAAQARLPQGLSLRITCAESMCVNECEVRGVFNKYLVNMSSWTIRGLEPRRHQFQNRRRDEGVQYRRVAEKLTTKRTAIPLYFADVHKEFVKVCSINSSWLCLRSYCIRDIGAPPSPMLPG